MTAAGMSLRPAATCQRAARPRAVRERSAMKLIRPWLTDISLSPRWRGERVGVRGAAPQHWTRQKATSPSRAGGAGPSLSPASGGEGLAPGAAPIASSGASKSNQAPRLFYGWIIVGAGIVITCLGMGTMMSLGIFLQPMSAATGWSRTSISTAALLNFLCMGPASFLWGALSDRFGTRAVVLLGGALLGLGLVAASQAGTVGQFQILFGMIIGVAAGSFYAPLTPTATR